MNHLFKTFLFLFVMLFPISWAPAADLTFDPPTIPNNAWQQHAEGIALACALIVKKDRDIQFDIINIYVKNTSESVKEFVSSRTESGVNIFYINTNGMKTPLRSHKDDDEEDVSINSGPIKIQPKEILSITIRLTPSELHLIQSHAITYSISIYDPSNKKQVAIEFLPKLLAERSDK